MGRSSSAWENTCVWRPGDEGPSSSRKLCKKLPRNWRIEKTLFSRGKDWKNIEDWKNFPRSMIRNPEQWVCWEIKYEAYKNDWNLLKTEKSGMILTHRAVTTVPTFLITSSSRKPSREVGMPRNTRENMSVPGHNFFFYCQQARRDPDELHDDSRNLAASSAIQRREGIEKSESEEPLQTIPLPCFSVQAREKV